MKTASIVALLVLACSIGWSGPIVEDGEFRTAVDTMERSDQIVLMIYTTDECPECAYMKRKVFHDRTVAPYLERRFRIIEKNVHKDPLPDGYDFFGLPTMFFIDRDGKRIATLVGSRRPAEFLKELRRIGGR